MKRSLKVVALVLVLVCSLMMSAFAADYLNAAEDLNAMGLLLGTGNEQDQYELDREPTRVEAGLMLLRLLGLYEEAGAGEYEHPFTDVPAWADTYVGYMYENGLTNGVSETEFGANSNCDAKMYVTFVLRSLGYDDAAGDFEYLEAVAFGKSVGVITSEIAGGTFLRDNMAAVSFMALFVQPKDESYDTLLEKLVADGAVTEEVAAAYLKKFELNNELGEVYKQLNVASYDITQTIEFTLSAEGVEDSSVKVAMDMQRKDVDGEIQYAEVSTVELDGESVTTESYYKDGYLYVNAGGEKVKVIAEVGAVGMTAGNPLYTIDSITKTTSGSNTVYTQVSKTGAQAGVDALEAVIGLAGLSDESDGIRVESCTITNTVDAEGNLLEQSMAFKAFISITIDGEAFELGCECTYSIVINATGDDVTVTFPSDLDSYTGATAA